MECTKCSKCGLPRSGHCDRKSRTEKRRIISSTSRSTVSFQLAAVHIQKIARTFIVQCRKRRNISVDKWAGTCVHYLYTKGPYGRRSINILDRHIKSFAVYSVASMQIQSAWRQYRWLKHLQLIGRVIQQNNAILLQRFWRATTCRRFFQLFQRLLRCDTESLCCHLIGSDTLDKDTCNISHSQHRIVIRLCAKSFPFAVHYQIRTLSSNKRIQETIPVWSIVEQKKFFDYMHDQLKLEHAAQRRKINKTQCMRCRSTRADAIEQRRERIRELSRRKFKWFYDRKERIGDDSLGQQPSIDDDYDEDDGSNNDGGSSNSDVRSNERNRKNGDGTELELMAWLRDLDLCSGA